MSDEQVRGRGAGGGAFKYPISEQQEPRPRREYIVLHAPGWPGGYQPVPNTAENARAFVRENGGIAKWRWTSDWEELHD